MRKSIPCLILTGTVLLTGCSSTSISQTPPPQVQPVSNQGLEGDYSEEAQGKAMDEAQARIEQMQSGGAQPPSQDAIGTPDNGPHVFSWVDINIRPNEYRVPTSNDTFQLKGENFSDRTVVILESLAEHTIAEGEHRDEKYILIHPIAVTPTTLNFKFPYDNSINKGDFRHYDVGVREAEATTVNWNRAGTTIVFEN